MISENIEFREKSDDFECFVENLNNCLLAPFGSPRSRENPRLSAQIVGLPRSGTTVLYQLMAHTRCVGYPSNLMALFWKTPTVGATIQKHLAQHRPTLSITSVAGRTREPMDPHEFGYFWRSMLGHSENTLVRDGEPIVMEELQTWLDVITEVFESPVVYKNFLALAHAAEMRAKLDRIRFIVTDRPLIDIAASLLALRQTVGADEKDWVGLRPPKNEIGELGSVVEMVAYQVATLEKSKSACRFVDSSDSYLVPYKSLCKNPRSIVAELLEFLEADLSQFKPEELPESLVSGSGASSLSKRERASLEKALETAMSRVV